MTSPRVKAASKTAWYCSECGHKQPRWTGQCSSCSAWNTMQEELEQATSAPITRAKQPATPRKLQEITSTSTPRISTNLVEFDRALGGGIVPGSLILIGGEPGIGKSTIALQMAQAMAKQVLYICGEESLEQVALRAKRLGVDSEHIYFLNEVEVGEIIRHVDELRPQLLIIDSIQIVYRAELASAPGSVSQVREATAAFMELAKSRQIATLLVGHVTKSGEIAGPKLLEHLVDTVLYFEGDKQQQFRLLRVVKNRFGPTDEIAVFQMGSGGLQEVHNPSQLFLEERARGAQGAIVIPTIEGTRPLLIEVQSLVTDTFYPSPSRRTTGLDSNRLALLLAVLEKRMRFHLYQCDVFVSVTGGFTVKEPAADLGVIVSIASSFRNQPLDPQTLVVGEVGLGGEVRGVSRIESRIKEGIHMGFSRCLLPKRSLKALASKELTSKIELIGIEWVDEAITHLLK